ncbi:MAG: uracil-DNA glycosylase [Acidobacteriota bacterium]
MARDLIDPASDAGELLAYLQELGFDELYLEPGIAPAPAESAPDLSTPAPARAASSEETSGAILPQKRPRVDSPPVEQDSLFAAPAAPPLSPEERLERLGAVRAEASGCVACRLAQTRRSVVFGSGDRNADLMFVGEGPGAEEDRRGEPFVGAAGELLTKIIRAIDLKREQVYICNTVKCRPPGNRDPQADELAACRGYLDAQIDLVQPRIIVALGRVAAQALLETKTSLGRLRGQWHRVRGVETRVTYHPAALLRNASWKRPTWEDLQLVRDRLAELRVAS